MNRAILANLNNSEIARLIECNQDIPRNVIDELVVRFVALVDNGTIEDDGAEREPPRDEREDELDELRGAISEAISVLESV